MLAPSAYTIEHRPAPGRAVSDGSLWSRQSWPWTSSTTVTYILEETTMARRSFLHRTIRNVLRGSSWLRSVGRYNETFSRIFRPGKWRPDQEATLWLGLFGMKTSPLSLVGTRRRDRNKMARLLRVEALESKQLLAADVFVNDNWVELTDVGGTPGTVENGDV